MQSALRDLSYKVSTRFKVARRFSSLEAAFILTNFFIDSRAFTANVTCLILRIILNLCLSSLYRLIASMQFRKRLDW